MEIPGRSKKKKKENISRSAPSRRTSGLLSCYSGSTDSLASTISVDSPQLGRYHLLPDYHFCDICQRRRRNTHHLKCMHSACEECLKRDQIMSRGCPNCDKLHRSHDPRDQSTANTIQQAQPGAPRDISAYVFREILDSSNSETQIRSLTETLEHKALPRVKYRYRTVREEMADMDKICELQVNTIRQHLTEMKTRLDRKAEELISSINESNRQHHVDLAHQEKYVQDMQQLVESHIEQGKDVIRNRSAHPDEPLQDLEINMMNAVALTEQIADERVHVRYHVYDDPGEDSDNPIGSEGDPEDTGDLDYFEWDATGVAVSKPKISCNVIQEENLDKSARKERDVQNMCGEVVDGVYIDPKMTVTRIQFLMVEGAVRTVCPINSSQAWVCFSQHVQLCSKTTGKTAMPIHVGEEVNDISKGINGDAILACHKSVKRLTFEKLTTLFPAENPVGIAQRADGNLVMIEEKDIVIRDIQGDLIHMVNCDVTFEVPFKLAINTNGDIIVSDYQASVQSVYILDSEGKRRATIQPRDMSPRGVSCNNQGLIFVTDFRSDRIYLYSQNGEFLQVILEKCDMSTTERHGRIQRGPQSAVLDTCGDLWVGDWNRRVFVFTIKYVREPLSPSRVPRSSPSRATGGATSSP